MRVSGKDPLKETKQVLACYFRSCHENFPRSKACLWKRVLQGTLRVGRHHSGNAAITIQEGCRGGQGLLFPPGILKKISGPKTALWTRFLSAGPLIRIFFFEVSQIRTGIGFVANISPRTAWVLLQVWHAGIMDDFLIGKMRAPDNHRSRIVCIRISGLPANKTRHGVAGIDDFTVRIERNHFAHGFASFHNKKFQPFNSNAKKCPAHWQVVARLEAMRSR